MMPADRNKVVLLAALIVCVYFFAGTGHGLIDPDEGRYAEIPREMLESGDYVTPKLNYVKYFEKPALHYWLTAASFAALGQNEFAARLVPVLFALGGIFLTFILTRKIYDSQEAVYASVILSTSLLWFAVAHINILDMTVSFFIQLSLTGFWYGQNSDQNLDQNLNQNSSQNLNHGAGPKNRRYLLLFYAGMALATLSKGLIGIVLPGGIVFWYIVLTRRWGLILRMLYVPGILLFFLLTAPWFWAVCRINDDFFYFFFVQEHFLRYTTRLHGRYQPFWYFIPVLAGGLVPWTGLLPAFVSGLKARESRGAERSFDIFLGVWFAVPFLFFSLSSSKLIPYILPCLPPLAVWGARSLADIREGDKRCARVFVRSNGILLLLLAAAGVVFPMLDKKIGAALFLYTLPAAVSLTAFALCGWRYRPDEKAGKPQYNKMVNAFCLLAFLNVLVFSRGFSLMAEHRSYKSAAAAIQEKFASGDIVASYGEIAQGLGFYLQRRIVLADAVGELEFGARQEKDERWFIDTGGFVKLWNGDSRVFLAVDKENLQRLEKLQGLKKNLVPISTAGDVLVLSNQGT